MSNIWICGHDVKYNTSNTSISAIRGLQWYVYLQTHLVTQLHIYLGAQEYLNPLCTDHPPAIALHWGLLVASVVDSWLGSPCYGRAASNPYTGIRFSCDLPCWSCRNNIPPFFFGDFLGCLSLELLRLQFYPWKKKHIKVRNCQKSFSKKNTGHFFIIYQLLWSFGNLPKGPALVVWESYLGWLLK